MAVYDLEEQEQLDALKAWWQQYGRLVILVAVAAVLAVGGIQGYRYYRHHQALEASELYLQLRIADNAGQSQKVRAIAATVVDKYAGTVYAPLAALAAAKAAVDGGEPAAAKVQLQWVVDHAKAEEVRDAARLRLAGVLLDEKQLDAALRLLEAKPVEAMAGLYADRKGDILVAQGKPAAARAQYQLALDKSDARSPLRNVIQLKLDALGDAK